MTPRVLIAISALGVLQRKPNKGTMTKAQRIESYLGGFLQRNANGMKDGESVDCRALPGGNQCQGTFLKSFACKYFALLHHCPKQIERPHT
jgi:hypothetical protein